MLWKSGHRHIVLVLVLGTKLTITGLVLEESTIVLMWEMAAVLSSWDKITEKREHCVKSYQEKHQLSLIQLDEIEVIKKGYKS
jgi:endonuclease V-like protein UPF0215 family